jgi:hypothetical protein
VHALLVVLGLVVYSPTLRAQIRAYDDAGPTSDEFKRASTRGTVVGAILAIDVIVIVLLMVTKPVLLLRSRDRVLMCRARLSAPVAGDGENKGEPRRAEAAPPLGTPVLNYVSPRWFIVEGLGRGRHVTSRDPPGSRLVHNPTKNHGREGGNPSSLASPAGSGPIRFGPRRWELNEQAVCLDLEQGFGACEAAEPMPPEAAQTNTRGYPTAHGSLYRARHDDLSAVC